MGIEIIIYSITKVLEDFRINKKLDLDIWFLNQEIGIWEKNF